MAEGGSRAQIGCAVTRDEEQLLFSAALAVTSVTLRIGKHPLIQTQRHRDMVKNAADTFIAAGQALREVIDEAEKREAQ